MILDKAAASAGQRDFFACELSPVPIFMLCLWLYPMAELLSVNPATHCRFRVRAMNPQGASGWTPESAPVQTGAVVLLLLGANLCGCPLVMSTHAVALLLCDHDVNLCGGPLVV